jgi:hypothetical protein
MGRSGKGLRGSGYSTGGRPEIARKSAWEVMIVKDEVWRPEFQAVKGQPFFSRPSREEDAGRQMRGGASLSRLALPLTFSPREGQEKEDASAPSSPFPFHAGRC